MSIEVVFQDERGRDRRFSPARDIAVVWPHLVAACVEGLEQQNWDEPMRQLLVPLGLRERELMEVLVTYTRFCERLLDPTMPDPETVLKTVGWFHHQPAAVLAFCYRLSVVCTGFFFSAIRSATPASEVPADVASLAAAGKQLMRNLLDEERREAEQHRDAAPVLPTCSTGAAAPSGPDTE